MTARGVGAIRTLAAEVDERLGPAGRERFRHVESVAATVRELAAAGGWPAEVASAAERAAWIHDALKLETPALWQERIVAAGEQPDAWALAHRPQLLHAQAAAVWAAGRGEVDPAVLSAVRHHPTAHPEWGPVGRLLYVADFCEPTRSYAQRLGSTLLRAAASDGEAGLERAARQVLGLRLAHLVASDRPIHPISWRAWNSWIGGTR